MQEPVAAGLTSVIVVAADSGPLLQKCIASVLASHAAVEIVLVDNASADGEVEQAIALHGAAIRLVRNTVNLGFGPACNRGAAIAGGDVLLVLNPDCELQASSISEMRAALSADDRIGLLGVTVCAPDGTPARGNRRRDPTLRRALSSASGLARLQSRWPGFAGVEMPARTDAQNDIETVEAVSGACMALPRSAFERVRGFDEAYFLHVEDLDLCRRVRNAGWRVAIAPAIRVTHSQGSSSRSRPLFVARHKHRSMWRYFCTYDPAAHNPLLRAGVYMAIWAHFGLTALRIAARRAFGASVSRA
jgi:GT2 family glycosyltransferase